MIREPEQTKSFACLFSELSTIFLNENVTKVSVDESFDRRFIYSGRRPRPPTFPQRRFEAISTFPTFMQGAINDADACQTSTRLSMRHAKCVRHTRFHSFVFPLLCRAPGVTADHSDIPATTLCIRRCGAQHTWVLLYNNCKRAEPAVQGLVYHDFLSAL